MKLLTTIYLNILSKLFSFYFICKRFFIARNRNIKSYLVLVVLLLITVFVYFLKNELYKTSLPQDNNCISEEPIASFIYTSKIKTKQIVINSLEDHFDIEFCDFLKSISDQIPKLDDYNMQYWNGTLFYCSNKQFCSQLKQSKELAQRLEAELRRPFDLTGNIYLNCDLRGHKVNSIGNVTLTNVYFFNYHFDYDCLRRSLTSDSFYDCPPEVSPCQVPNISHVVWYGRDRPLFRFHHYISVRSDLIELRPHALLIWFDGIPQGDWFYELLIYARDYAPHTKLFLVQRNGVEIIYNRPIKVSEHKADVVRLEAVLQFGGFYHDLDVVILRSFSSLRQYTTTFGHEFEPVNKPYKSENGKLMQTNKSNSPSYSLNLKQVHGLCNGVIISAPQSHFLRMYHFEYTRFDDSNWGWHPVLLPAIISSVSNHFLCFICFFTELRNYSVIFKMINYTLICIEINVFVCYFCMLYNF